MSKSAHVSSNNQLSALRALHSDNTMIDTVYAKNPFLRMLEPTSQLGKLQKALEDHYDNIPYFNKMFKSPHNFKHTLYAALKEHNEKA